MHIITVENQREKQQFQSGQKIYHDQYGRGIIVGFSSFTDEPLVYFYNGEVQNYFNDRLIAVSGKDITVAQ